MKSKPRCPICGSSETVPILYGFPSEESFKAASRGEAKLGGCIMDDANPEFHCKNCNHDFRGGTNA